MEEEEDGEEEEEEQREREREREKERERERERERGGGREGYNYIVEYTRKNIENFSTTGRSTLNTVSLLLTCKLVELKWPYLRKEKSIK